MAVVLEARGLNKSFGAVSAAADINVAVERDSVVGLIGSNGAGKTTFINLVTGYLKPSPAASSSAAATSRGWRRARSRGSASAVRFRSRSCSTRFRCMRTC